MGTTNKNLRKTIGVLLLGSVTLAAAIMQDPQQAQGRKSTDPPTFAKGKMGQDLFLAIDHRNTKAVEDLLKKGADPNSRNGLEFTPLYIAAASHQPDVMKALLAAGARADEESSYGTPLLFAAATAHLDGVKMLLEKGADPAAARNDGMTVLMMAANAGHPGVVAELLARKVDVNALDDNDTTALALAARGGNTMAANLLIGAGAKIDQADLEGITPLMSAAMNGRSEIVETLIKAGAKPNLKDKQGRNALVLSTTAGDYPAIVKTLLAAGSEGKDAAAALATKRGFDKSAELLGRPSTEALKALGPVRTAKQAIPMTIKTMEASMEEFSKNTNCLSCHQEGLGRIALGEAKDKGFTISQPIQEEQLKRLHGMLTGMKPLHEGALKDPEVMKQLPLIEMNEVTSAYSWLMAGMAGMKDAPSEAAEAMALVLGRQQSPAGFWSFSMPRLPMQSSFFTSTALSVQSLKHYGPKANPETAERIAKAKAWMLKEPAKTSEDRASRLLGLFWAGTTAAERKLSVEEILKDQLPDGGWSQMPGMQSDAYATGQALYALSKTGGIPAEDPRFQKGIQLLLRTQDQDGTWFVNKRAIPANNYFDAKFPHGQSQYASFNGTTWALMALVESVKKQ